MGSWATASTTISTSTWGRSGFTSCDRLEPNGRRRSLFVHAVHAASVLRPRQQLDSRAGHLSGPPGDRRPGLRPGCHHGAHPRARSRPAADAVVFLNAIHLMPDKEQVLKEIRRVLKPGGLLAFNSTFFNGAYVEGTSGFWRRWIVRSVQALREKGLEVKHTGHAAAMEWFSAEQYSAACTAAGLRPTTVELLRVEMTAESLADIGRFSLFIEGALPGAPLEEGSAALQTGLARTLDELKVDSVPRHWLEVVAEAV